MERKGLRRPGDWRRVGAHVEAQWTENERLRKGHSGAGGSRGNGSLAAAVLLSAGGEERAKGSVAGAAGAEAEVRVERRVSNNEWSRRSQPVSCRPRAARAWRFVVADSAGLAAFLVSQGFGWLWMARAMSPIVENGLEVAYVATGGALAALCSWLVADALSGLIHRAADTWGSVGWPVVGPLLLRPFREHHVQPLTILDHGFLERSGQNGLLAACPTSFWLLGVSENGRLELFLGAFVLLLGLWIMATNEIHAWAHAQEAPRLVRWLQRRGLVLSPEQHWLHHSGHHDSHYCITSGFWDRLWDRASAMAERPRARRRL